MFCLHGIPWCFPPIIKVPSRRRCLFFFSPFDTDVHTDLPAKHFLVFYCVKKYWLCFQFPEPNRNHFPSPNPRSGQLSLLKATFFFFWQKGKQRSKWFTWHHPRSQWHKKEDRSSHKVTCPGSSHSILRVSTSICRQIKRGWLTQSTQLAVFSPQGLPGMMKESICRLACWI